MRFGIYTIAFLFGMLGGFAGLLGPSITTDDIQQPYPVSENAMIALGIFGVLLGIASAVALLKLVKSL